VGLLIAIVIVGILAVAGWLGFRLIRQKVTQAAGSMSRLAGEGVGVTGRIASTERRRMSRGQFEYYVTYAFKTPDDAEYGKELRVQATRFDEYVGGQPIEIVYLPSDPTQSATREVVDKVRGEIGRSR
jgi:hypothetical protein